MKQLGGRSEVKKIQKRNMGGLALVLVVCTGCGADNDQLLNPPAAETTAPDGNDMASSDTSDDDADLEEADQLTSGDENTGSACSACPTPVFGASCCTNADDVTAVRATEGDVCGVD